MRDRYILEKFSFIDTYTNQCLNYNIKDLKQVCIELNNKEEEIIKLENKLTTNSNLPVYVGQELYSVQDSGDSFHKCYIITKVKVYAIRIDTKKHSQRFCVEAINKNSYYLATFSFNSIGKSIFYNLKEANERLKKLKKNN